MPVILVKVLIGLPQIVTATMVGLIMASDYVSNVTVNVKPVLILIV